MTQDMKVEALKEACDLLDEAVRKIRLLDNAFLETYVVKVLDEESQVRTILKNEINGLEF